MSSEITMVDDVKERRDFFRIDDSVSMSYQEIKPEELSSRMENTEVEGNFTVMSSLASINQNMSGILHRIEDEDQDVAAYLKAINNKIDIIGRALLSCESDLTEQPAQPVNLSASGLAFFASEPVKVGVILELKLLLMPSFTGIITFGEIVGCDQVDEPVDGLNHLTRVIFMHMKEKDCDLLIRHVIQRQSEILRERREQSE
ncbi:MAG: PilZ domain-containing protein [Gammaproteobacteria bacterium]|nr:PilZ domain-containing protein [Gammaproteobacteria bacterium]